ACHILMLLSLTNACTPEFDSIPLHDALPISARWRGSICSPAPVRSARPPPCRLRSHRPCRAPPPRPRGRPCRAPARPKAARRRRSEEHTSELQSRENLVCRLLLEKKTTIK